MLIITCGRKIVSTLILIRRPIVNASCVLSSQNHYCTKHQAYLQSPHPELILLDDILGEGVRGFRSYFGHNNPESGRVHHFLDCRESKTSPKISIFKQASDPRSKSTYPVHRRSRMLDSDKAVRVGIRQFGQAANTKDIQPKSKTPGLKENQISGNASWNQY